MTTVDVSCAAELLNFAAKLEPQRAREQLEGAVALHNILNKHKVAYLADEVGMGKTYVALGVLALFRHFQPDFRVLVIAPRANIQRKWLKESKNFVRNNVRFCDLRVKGLDGRPVRDLVSCESLVDLVKETTMDPDRDFFMRMTSFSLALGKENTSWDGVREKLLKQLPWLDARQLPLHGTDKAPFKNNYGRALCAALPTFDLVIVDEGHNLKHGFSPHGAARNRMIAHTFGHPDTLTSEKAFRLAGPRAKRVLFLSATPVEERYDHLWNQMDVFGLAAPYALLKNPTASEEEKKALIANFLVRRVTSIRAGSVEVTKNQYRQEWRSGGMTTFDEPITITDDRQKLTVALVQKKVSETLAALADDKFGMNFQVGMLASFESFQETALPKKLRPEDDEEQQGSFDGSDQTENALEKEGVDVRPVNKLARQHRKVFGREMAHPKMDALVGVLSRSWETGRKGLVFVRRVASVKEIKRRLDDAYDAWLMGKLRAELPPDILTTVESQFQRYKRAREEAVDEAGGLLADEILAPRHDRDDKGGNDTFFAYYFRGEGRGELSGAAVARNLARESSQFATFFRRNLVSELLEARPGGVFPALCKALGRPESEVRDALVTHARAFLGNQKKVTRGDRFHAAQGAAFELLRKLEDGPGPKARVWWHHAFEATQRSRAREGDVGDVASILEEPTFWTELEGHPELCSRLLPAPSKKDLHEAFLETERRCQLLAASLRLGHPLLDLYVVLARRLSQSKSGEAEDTRTQHQVIVDFLLLLDKQRQNPEGARWGAWAELSAIADNFHLIRDVNLDRLDDETTSLAGYFGALLGSQQPVGGMAGKVNKRLVTQFRMPGYPMVLITTDILQEGEDLHTFCSDVYHYGISWTPSSMEQRTGRIDRVRSETDRRVSRLNGPPAHKDRLHVYLPHLADTVEVLQVQRVLGRMNAFMRLMHEGLGKKPDSERTVNVTRAILEHAEHAAPPVPDDKPLKTAFPVHDADLKGQTKRLAVAETVEAEALARFAALIPTLKASLGVQWEPEQDGRRLFGTAGVDGGRIQPFTLLLQSFQGAVVVRCVSPVGRLRAQADDEDYWREGMESGVGLGVVEGDDEDQSYDVTAEGDVTLWNPADDARRVSWLVKRVVAAADQLERQYLPDKDRPMDEFRTQLKKETEHGA